MLAAGNGLTGRRAGGGVRDQEGPVHPADRLYATTTGSTTNHRPATAHTPGYVSDPGWPAPLPHNWLLGQIGGLMWTSHDHIWIYNRPRTMTTDGAALDVRGGSGGGKNGLGFARPNGAVAETAATPRRPVLEFDTAGKLLRAWGGPADPGWLESHIAGASPMAASGPIASTASMSITTTVISGWRAMAPKPVDPIRAGPPTRRVATASS